jgi:hypothetical protein
MDCTMTEPHVIGIDSRDLRDLIDDRDRLETSLAECARSAMNSADEWQAELDKAGAVNAELQRFHRDVQEALGYSGLPGSVAMADLVADIRVLVEKQLAWATYPGLTRPYNVERGPATEPAAPTHRDLGAGWGMSTDELGHHQVPTPPAEPATPAYAAGGVVSADVDVFQAAARAIDNFSLPGWSHDQDSPPAAPHPRTWKTGDDEPATAGPGAVWGVTTEIGDLYRPQADEEHGWVWARADGTWWRWETMLIAGPVTEVFPPSPTPHTVDVEPPADTEETPAPEALAVPVASDNTTTTDPAWTQHGPGTDPAW